MKKIESGRSMIEMLGVLAIIGVLSIGGLAGYTMAMNRHRANQVIDYISNVAVAAGTKGLNGISEDTACGKLVSMTLPGTIKSDGTTTLNDCKAHQNDNGTITVSFAYATGTDAVASVLHDRIVSGKIGSATVTETNTKPTSFTFEN